MKHLFSGGHYMVTNGYGDLFVRNVRAEDGLKQFSCLAVNSLTGERQQSEAVYLDIKGKGALKL
jgi:hypothetical protein